MATTNPIKPRRRTARAWARLIADWQKSGKTAADFAASRGLVARTLTWWKWRLASRAPEAPTPALRLVPIHIEPPPHPAPATQAPPTPLLHPSPAWEIITAQGHLLRVHRAIDKVALDTLLDALSLRGGVR